MPKMYQALGLNTIHRTGVFILESISEFPGGLGGPNHRVSDLLGLVGSAKVLTNISSNKI